LAKVLDFIIPYEAANWSEVSRQMIVNDIEEEAVSKAYMDSLAWYRDLMAAEK